MKACPGEGSVMRQQWQAVHTEDTDSFPVPFSHCGRRVRDEGYPQDLLALQRRRGISRALLLCGSFCQASTDSSVGAVRSLGCSCQLFASMRRSAPLGFWKTRRPNSGRMANRWSKMSDWVVSWPTQATVLVKQ